MNLFKIAGIVSAVTIGGRYAVDYVTKTTDTTSPYMVILEKEETSSDTVMLDITVTDKDSGVKCIQLPDGSIVNGDTAEFEVNKIGEYLFKAIDNNNNEHIIEMSDLDFEVYIPDKAFHKVLNKDLSRGETLEPIYKKDLESLTRVNGLYYKEDIYNISGIQYATNLNSINLGGNRVVDISPISKLYELTSIGLYDNGIVDMSPLKDLSKLTWLEAHWNKFESIDALANKPLLRDVNLAGSGNLNISLKVFENSPNLRMLAIGIGACSDLQYLLDKTSLEHLEIRARDRGTNLYPSIKNSLNMKVLRLDGFNIGADGSELANFTKLEILSLANSDYITDYSFLSSLSNMKQLSMNGSSQVSYIPSLSHMTNLNYLNLPYKNISDISFLEGVESLKEVYLHGNPISDFEPLSSLTQIINLGLAKCNISEASVGLDGLSQLSTLNTLELQDNNITNIKFVERLNDLKNLYLQNNSISNIEPIKNLINLVNLRLDTNNVTDVSSLKNLINLNTLYLNGNQITDITELGGLINLKNLYLNDNQILDITELSSLTNLNALYLSSNQILDISSLTNLTDLTDLRLGNNPISDMSALDNLTNLTRLEIFNTQISDISSISNLTNLNYLYLHNNKIYDISSINNLKNLVYISLSNQSPVIEIGDFKSKTDKLDISINNPIFGLNNKVSNLTNLSNNGVYENGKLKWNNLLLGSHTRTFNFSESVTIGSASTTFNGFATLNLNVVDKGEPESDHTSEFDSNDFGIYTTVTATDLGEGVSHLIHKGVRYSLPYRFKYDAYNPINNIVEVYDLAGNKADYQVKLKYSDIPSVEEGLDALTVKNNITKEDISYFRAIINNLDESSNKDLLQDRLNLLSTTDTLERKTATGNLDVYIKSQNMLSMSLDINSITFDGYSGTEDMEMLGAVNISINSSLPYSLNAYMPTEIANSDNSETIPINILNIREESGTAYQTFVNTADKIVLKDNCAKGNGVSHGIDLKLSSNLAHKADVYKTVIKFEAEQK